MNMKLRMKKSLHITWFTFYSFPYKTLMHVTIVPHEPPYLIHKKATF